MSLHLSNDTLLEITDVVTQFTAESKVSFTNDLESDKLQQLEDQALHCLPLGSCKWNHTNDVIKEHPYPEA